MFEQRAGPPTKLAIGQCRKRLLKVHSFPEAEREERASYPSSALDEGPPSPLLEFEGQLPPPAGVASTDLAGGSFSFRFRLSAGPVHPFSTCSAVSSRRLRPRTKFRPQFPHEHGASSHSHKSRKYTIKGTCLDSGPDPPLHGQFGQCRECLPTVHSFQEAGREQRASYPASELQEGSPPAAA